MTVEQMENWSNILLVVAIVSFILAIVLFFALGIKKAFYIVTGRTVKKKASGKDTEQKKVVRKPSTTAMKASESKKLKNNKMDNKTSVQEVRHEDKVDNNTRVLDMNVQEDTIWKGYENTSVLTIGQANATTLLDTGGDATSVLNAGGDATTVLNAGGDATSVLSAGGNATTVLNAGRDATTVLNAGGDATTVLNVAGATVETQGKKLDMVVDIVFVHTDVAI